MSRSTKGGGSKSSKKNRKFDRNRSSVSNKRYIAGNKQEINKIRKMIKALRRGVNDQQLRNKLIGMQRHEPITFNKAAQYFTKEVVL